MDACGLFFYSWFSSGILGINGSSTIWVCPLSMPTWTLFVLLLEPVCFFISWLSCNRSMLPKALIWFFYCTSWCSLIRRGRPSFNDVVSFILPLLPGNPGVPPSSKGLFLWLIPSKGAGEAAFRFPVGSLLNLSLLFYLLSLTNARGSLVMRWLRIS